MTFYSLRRLSVVQTVLLLVLSSPRSIRCLQHIRKMYDYPNVRRSDHKDMIHGIEVNDPYRWLETSSDETKAFVTNQNKCSETYLNQIPYRESLKNRMTELYNYEKFSCPFTCSGKYFYYQNDGLQNQSILYMKDTLDSKESSIVLDPNKLSEDGTAALSATALSEGKTSKIYFAHGISRGGSDWQTIQILDVTTGELLNDTVEYVKFSRISWLHDDSGFFYSRYPPPPEQKEGSNNNDNDDVDLGTETNQNLNHQIWFHKLGTKQEDDRLIFAYTENPSYYLSAEVSDDGNYLILYINDGCKNASMVYMANLDDTFNQYLDNKSLERITVQKLVDNMDYAYEYLLNNGTEFFFQTNDNAQRERVIKCNVSEKEIKWIEVIPEPTGNIVLESVIPFAKDYLIVKYLEDVKNVITVYLTDGTKVTDIDLPDVGTAGISGKRSDDECFLKFISFLHPGSVYRIHVSDWKPTLYRDTYIPGFDASQYETKQVFYPSKDGTMIPMFIVGKKDMSLSKNNPVYLYGYGGFNVTLKPSFSIFRLVFVQHFGGVLAIPNLRGGGEYGEEWHQLGTFDKKQNVFDDFHSAAEYLIKNDYTTSNKIAIHGGSNGGLLVAACANQRPDLYSCGVAAVGVLDMIRFHKFTCGAGWRTDYGDPDTEFDFKYIMKYSPLHNVPNKDTINNSNDSSSYPSLLLTTADHDDRVVPLHSYKFIAEVQHQLGKVNKNPLLIRIETKAGHGAGKPTSKIIEEYADVYAFIGYTLQCEFVLN